MKNFSHSQTPTDARFCFQSNSIESNTYNQEVTREDIINNLSSIHSYLGIGGKVQRSDCQPFKDYESGEIENQIEYGKRMYARFAYQIKSNAQKCIQKESSAKNTYGTFYSSQDMADIDTHSHKIDEYGETGTETTTTHTLNLPDGTISLIEDRVQLESDDSPNTYAKIIIKKPNLAIAIHPDGSVKFEETRGYTKLKKEKMIRNIGYMDYNDLQQYINFNSLVLSEIEQRAKESQSAIDYSIVQADKHLKIKERENQFRHEPDITPGKPPLEEDIESELEKIYEEK